ncbi:NAC domain-containing protein 91-like [Papaver somniferum]|uniref:NAC domain-containing protein 91-like n=1 Tax=Papaver somniferum TaxID=3469 RepID=UPI000E6FC909|nr:NAC domain-containing protein 91-like [Papaver somniferum]
MDFGEEEIPRGYKFNPTDHQLIEYYLTPKVLGKDMGFCSWFLFEKDLYNDYSNPLVLFDEINQNYDKRYFCDDKEKGEQIRYFFTPIVRVSKTGKNIRRTTRDGKWGEDGGKAIIQPGINTLIGTNKSYKFSWKGDSEYAKRGKQSSWIMHEISLPQTFYDSRGMKEEFVVCWIKRRGGAHADNQILQQPPPFPVPQPSTTTMLSPSISAHQVPRKRQRFEEPDASSSGVQDDMLQTNQRDDLSTCSSTESLLQEQDNLGEFVGFLEAELEVNNDELMMNSKFGEDNSVAEAMKKCVPVPASTTMFTPSLDAVPTQQPCYDNGPYMSSPLWVQTPSAKIIAPEVRPVQPSYVNLQPSTSTLPIITADAGSLFQAPSTEIFSSTEVTPLNNNDNCCDMMAEFSRTSILLDNLDDIIMGRVEDTGDKDDINFDEIFG